MYDDQARNESHGPGPDPFAPAEFPSNPPYVPPPEQTGRIEITRPEHAAPPTYAPPPVGTYSSAPSYYYAPRLDPAGADTRRGLKASTQRKFWIGGITTLVVVGMAATLAYRALPNYGAGSPDQAMERFSEAILTQDWLNVFAMIEPTERRVFLERIDDFQDELVRLEFLDESESDLRQLGEVSDLTVTDLVTSVVPVNDDIYQGWIDNAQLTGSYDLSKMPDVASLMGLATSDTVDTTINTRSENFPVALVERDGKWYVSITYTASEALRIDTDSPPPNPAERLTPIGAETPDEAATQFVTSIASFDLTRTIAMMDPLEIGAIADYWSQYRADVEGPTRELQAELNNTMAFTVSDIEWDVTTDGDDAWGSLTRGRFSFMTISDPEPVEIHVDVGRDDYPLVISGTGEGSTFEMRMQTTDGDFPFTVTGTGGSGTFTVSITETTTGYRATGQENGEPVEVDLSALGDCMIISGTLRAEAVHEEFCSQGLEANWRSARRSGSVPRFTLRLRRVDDLWYVSPSSTILDYALELLKGFQPEDRPALEALFETASN